MNTNKIDLIKAEVERIQLYTQSEVLKQVLDYIDEVQKEPVSEDKITISKEWFEHCKKSWYNEGYIDGEYNRDRQFEDSVSNDLMEASLEFAKKETISKTFPDDEKFEFAYAFEKGAKWNADQFEKERLKLCNTLTKEQAQMESDFVVNFIKKNNCTPTFIDAIEYGMKLKLKDGK